MEQREAEVNGVKWRALIEQKASRGKLWAAFGLEQLVRRMVERFAIKKAWAISVLEDAENVVRLQTDGRWQHETPYKEKIELLRHSNDLRFEGVLMRQAYNAGKSGGWANYIDKFLGKKQAERMDKCEGETILR